MGLPPLDGPFAAHGVAVAYLFGSRAAGTAAPTSDHDIAVLFASAAPGFDATERLGRELRPRWTPRSTSSISTGLHWSCAVGWPRRAA